MKLSKWLNIFLLFIILPLGAVAQWYYGSGEATNLENVIGFSKHTQKIVTGSSSDPSAGSGYAAAVGSLFLPTNDVPYVKTDTSDTDWSKLAKNSTFDEYKLKVETITEMKADKVLYSTWDVSGLTNATFNEEVIPHLTGTKSYLFTNVTASVDEILESPDVTLPFRSKGKDIAVVFNYVYDGDSSDIRAYLYDVTNSAELGSVSLVAASTAKQVAISGYALSTTATVSLRFEIDVVNNGKKLIFDDVVFTDDPFVYKDLAEMTDWVSYTPTGSWNNTTYSGRWRRVGDTMEVFAKGVLTNAPTSADLRVDIPSGYLIDTTKINVTTQGGQSLGHSTLMDNGTKNWSGTAMYYDTNTVSVISDANGGEVASGSIPFTWAANDEFTVTAKFPIANWTSATEHIVTPRTAPKQYDLTVTGTNWVTAFATGTYYIDQTGKHRLKFNIKGTVSSASRTSYTVDINGIDFKLAQLISGGHALTSSTASAYTNASNDLTWYHPTETTDEYHAFGDVELDSKPTWADPVTSQYLAAIPEPLYAEYTSIAADEVGTTLTDLSFATKVKDTHNAWDGDTFTAPFDSAYTFKVSILGATVASASGNMSINMLKNGVGTKTYIRISEAAKFQSQHASFDIYLLKGDTISFKAFFQTTSNLSGSAGINYVTIKSN